MVAAAVLAALDITAEAWKRLTPEQKKKLRAKYDEGAKGLAKAWAKTWAKNTKNAKKTVKTVSKTFAKKKGKGKR